MINELNKSIDFYKRHGSKVIGVIFSKEKFEELQDDLPYLAYNQEALDDFKRVYTYRGIQLYLSISLPKSGWMTLLDDTPGYNHMMRMTWLY